MDWEFLADQPLWEKLIKKGSLTYLFILLVAPVGYFIRVIASNTLSVEDIGLFYSISGLVTLISMYNDLWLTEALQYFLPKYRIEKRYNDYKTIVYLTLFVQVISGIIIAGLMRRGADWLSIHHFHSPIAKNILRLFCVYFIGINFLQVFSSIYISFQDVVANNISEVLKMRSTLVFTVFFRLTGSLTINSFSLWWISGLWIGLAASILVFIVKYQKTLKKWVLVRNKSLLKTQFHYAFRVFLWANIGVLFSQVDQQIVINFLGDKQAWYYANFWWIIAMFGMIVGPIFWLLFPIVNELIIKNEIKKLTLFQNHLYKYFSVFALTVSWLFIALGPRIASVMFGVKFVYSGILSMYIWPFLVFNTLSTINYFILAWLGKIKERVKVLWIALIINVTSNIILIYWLWLALKGALISVILWRIVLWRLSFRLINSHLKITFDWKFFTKNILITIGLSSAAYIIGYNILIMNDTMRYQNIAYLLVITIVYYCIIFSLNLWSVKMMINEIRWIKK
jgi:O-antigen/teichoic acid export membrane protein